MTVEWTGRVQCQFSDAIDVPQTHTPLSPTQLTQLHNLVNHMVESDITGVDLYVAVMELYNPFDISGTISHEHLYVLVKKIFSNILIGYRDDW